MNIKQFLNEKLIEINVKDKNDPSKKVKLVRYSVDHLETPTAVLFGKFNPWSGPKGHGRLLEFAKNTFKQVIIVIPESFDDTKLNVETRKEIILKLTGIDPIILPKCPIKAIHRNLETMGISRPVLIVGPDRAVDFENDFIPYEKNREGITDENDKDFSKGEFLFLDDRGEENTSATLVRKALNSNNKEDFLRLTGYSENVFYFLKEKMKELISEGGNGHISQSEIKNETSLEKYLNIKSDKMKIKDLDSDKYLELQKDIKKLLASLNGLCFQKTKNYIWDDVSQISKNNIFSGSTKLFFELDQEEFREFKDSLGDIDVTVPENKKDKIIKFLTSIIGTNFGKLEYAGFKKSANQIINFFLVKNEEMQNISTTIQIDFEFQDYEKGKPSEFAVFSHSSDMMDFKSGIKGLFHKFLLMCIASSLEKVNDIVIVSLKSKAKNGNYRIVKKDKTSASLFTFSNDRGLRQKYFPVLDQNQNQIKIDKDGKINKDGIPAYYEKPTEDSIYTTNLKQIFKILFPKESELNFKEMFSFIELLSLCKKNFTDEQIISIYKSFLMKCFGDDSQKLDRDDVNVDLREKTKALNRFFEEFPELSLKGILVDDKTYSETLSKWKNNYGKHD